MSRFVRKYEMSIGTSGQEDGILISENQIIFDIKKSADSTMNSASFDIYNLSIDTRAKITSLEENDGLLFFKVGYGSGDLIQIFQGNIIQVINSSKGQDIVTSVLCGDGYTSYRDAKTSRTFPEKTTLGTVLTALIQDMSLAKGVFKGDALSHVFNKGIVTDGKAAQEMDDYVYNSQFKLQWSVQDSVCNVLPVGESTTETALVLDESNGLIGSPEQTGKKVGKEKGSEVPNSGANASSLLNPEISINRSIALRSKWVNGVYICKSLNHRGDFEGTTWQTDMELVSTELREV